MIVVAFGVLTLWLFPVVIDPLFNDFERSRRARCARTCWSSRREAGVDVGEVYRVDASRRTTAANAYVGGLGHTKRVVLYDNLIDGFPRDQVRARGGARARPPEAQRPPARPAVARARGARRHAS